MSVNPAKLIATWRPPRSQIQTDSDNLQEIRRPLQAATIQKSLCSAVILSGFPGFLASTQLPYQSRKFYDTPILQAGSALSTCVHFSRILRLLSVILFVAIFLSANSAAAQTTEIPGITTIDSTGDVGLEVAITLTRDGHLAVTYQDISNLDLKLWVDNGEGGGVAGNAQPDGAEIKVIDSAGDFAEFSSITLDRNGYLAISYEDIGNRDLKLWLDDGAGGGTAGNAIAEGTEVRTIDSTDEVGAHTGIALDRNGNLAVSYFDATNCNLKLWIDDGAGGGIAGNGLADGTEIRVIDTNGHSGVGTSITFEYGRQSGCCLSRRRCCCPRPQAVAGMMVPEEERPVTGLPTVSRSE